MLDALLQWWAGWSTNPAAARPKADSCILYSIALTHDHACTAAPCPGFCRKSKTPAAEESKSGVEGKAGAGKGIAAK